MGEFDRSGMLKIQSFQCSDAAAAVFRVILGCDLNQVGAQAQAQAQAQARIRTDRADEMPIRSLSDRRAPDTPRCTGNSLYTQLLQLCFNEGVRSIRMELLRFYKSALVARHSVCEGLMNGVTHQRGGKLVYDDPVLFFITISHAFSTCREFNKQ